MEGSTVGKHIQLPVSVMEDMYRIILLLDDYELGSDVRSVLNRLEDALNTKMEAIEKRRAYNEYKTASSDELKEAARQKYLNLAGIHSDWRWSAEAEAQRRTL